MTILKTRTRWVGVLLLASCTLVGSSALAQEEATSEDKQQLTTEVEIMKALRAGKWNAEQVETLILGLEEKGYARAAAWWATQTQAAIKKRKLPQRLAGKMKRHQKRLASVLLPAAEQKTLQKGLAKHLKTLISRRNHAESRRVLPAALAMLAAYPDKGMSRILAGIEKKVSANKGAADLNPKMLSRHREVSETLRASATKIIHARIEADLDEYLAAGCEAGRLAIKHCIIQLYGSVELEAARALIVRLRRARRDLEVTGKVAVWILGDPSSMTVTRDGDAVPVVGKRSRFATDILTPIVFDALPGDQIRFHPTGGREKSGKLGPGGLPTNSVLLVRVEWKGRAIPVKHWSSIPATARKKLEPTLYKILEGQRVAAKLKYSADDLKVRRLDPKSELFEVEFPNPLGEGSFMYLWNGYYKRLEDKLRAKNISFSWITAVTKDSIYVLRIPG